MNLKTSICMMPLLVFVVLASGCKKFLDEKPDKKLVIPSTLADLQALMDYYPTINNYYPGSDEVSADDYYLTNADFNALTESFRRMYAWEKDRLYNNSSNDWKEVYDVVYVANTILEHLGETKRETGDEVRWKDVKGQALFHRANALLKAAFIWAPAFEETTAATDLGLPLRLNPDFNEPSVRSSVQDTYERIITDLKEAISLLPVTPLHVMRPSRPAAYALLARTYLSMRRYEQAGLYADSCLQLHHQLLDYNTLNANATYPVPPYNAEVIMEIMMPFPSPLSNSRAKIDSTLYNSYAANDLRKKVFFKSNNNGTYGFKGSYEGASNLFGGITTGEVYLMRAEAHARAGKTTEAMDDLNTLLEKRWKTGTFTSLTASDAADALNKVLEERRKELLMRGLRWMDLKRLNKEPQRARTLIRVINGEIYTLPPNDPRYALPIPEDVIAFSGMPQNPR